MSIPRSEHPRPDRYRETWLNINGEWDFEIDNARVGLEKKFYERATLNDKIIVPFSPESVLSGVGNTDFMNAVWYRRDIEIPESFSGKRVLLHIDACDHTTTVFVNGAEVGKHAGGYTSFCFDINQLSSVASSSEHGEHSEKKSEEIDYRSNERGKISKRCG